MLRVLHPFVLRMHGLIGRVACGAQSMSEDLDKVASDGGRMGFVLTRVGALDQLHLNRSLRLRFIYGLIKWEYRWVRPRRLHLACDYQGLVLVSRGLPLVTKLNIMINPPEVCV